MHLSTFFVVHLTKLYEVQHESALRIFLHVAETHCSCSMPI